VSVVQDRRATWTNAPNDDRLLLVTDTFYRRAPSLHMSRYIRQFLSPAQLLALLRPLLLNLDLLSSSKRPPTPTPREPQL
jgi:hypothetical protein